MNTRLREDSEHMPQVLQIPKNIQDDITDR